VPTWASSHPTKTVQMVLALQQFLAEDEKPGEAASRPQEGK
jgi:hypothetical protein